MKKIFFCMMAILSMIVFAACSEDKDYELTEIESMLDLDLSKQSSFIGMWSFGNIDSNGLWDMYERVTIKANGTMYREKGAYTFNDTYTFSNGTITKITTNDADDITKYTFHLYNKEVLKVDEERNYHGIILNYSYYARLITRDIEN